MVTYHEDEQNKLLADLKSQEEESLTQSTATQIGIPYRDLTGESINSDALRLITEEYAKKAEMAAFAMVGKKLDIAVKSPTNDLAVREINRLEKDGYETSLFMISQRSLDKAWDRYNDISQSESARGGLLDISDENLQEIVSHVHTNQDIQVRLKEIFEAHDSHQVSRIMETIFGSAIAVGSSDVHLEPEEAFTRLRLREDGVLQEIIQIDPVVYQKLLNRVKFISGMKLTNTDTAQDGRFTIFYKGMEVEVRVAVAPGAYNESIVLRILNPEGLAQEFDKLGIEPRLFKIIEREITKPNGMILTTGPTGSGKTTTLYSFLKHIYSPEIKIITIEDPIEYHLTGITQEQVNHEKGFDFLAGLRAALRQDPDVIMVGEIRDKETATIAINASLTGHMVFSTLHTNGAAGTIPRLLDLGIQPGILAAALTVSLAQRLVRKLCPHCKKELALDQEQITLLRTIIKNGERLGKDFAHYNITSDMDFTVYSPVGCDQCGKTGFKGRVGLYEAILTDDIIAKEMAKIPTPTERDIKKAAEHQKIFTMIEDGVIKILTGITSIDEIQGVVDLSEDVGDTNSIPSPSSWQEEGNRTSESPKGTSQRNEGLIPDVSTGIPAMSEKSLSGTSEVRRFTPTQETDELLVLIEYLKALEHDLENQQKLNHEIHIENQLLNIRNNIQIMLREVAQ